MEEEFEKSFEYVRHVVENEGFDYAFTSMSDFPEIEDDEFHKLRKLFLEARANLCEYLNLENN